MSKKMLIDATHAEETRVVVVDGNRVEEFDFETINKRQIAGNIYLAKVTRVEPSLQAAFVDYGGNRHGFLAFAEIHPDYYQIPLADRKALIEEERAFARAEEDEDNRRARPARDERARDENPRDDKPRDENSGREGGRNDRRTRGRGRGRNDARRDDTLAGGEETLAAAEQDGTNTDASGALDSADQPNSDFAPENDGDAGPSTMAHPVEGDETIAGPDLGGDVLPAASPSGMEVVDFSAEDEPQSDNDNSEGDNSEGSDNGTHVSNDNGQYRAIDHASDSDDEIESIAEEDIAEEIAAPRRPRARRYKIQEVIKVRQIMLVQVVKEERGNKGAALTTYLSLAGRYCVLMPNTARGGGISRKIVMAADRKKLKEIAQEIEVPEGAGLIIRTAGAKRTKPEIKRDYEYLMRLWEQIRELTLKSMAPAAIYEEGDLIKRTIRDLYSSEIDEILVEGEGGYRTAKDFMRMIMPAHAKQVVRYTDPNPLFARYGVEAYLSGMFNPTVQLKSGGYIVIGITEALVAIDVNSGRATKEGSIEDTALKTNLEAAEEVARQLRLRDLAGLIVIDFIDMEERRNNAAVEKRLKDRLKTDRARIQVGRISGFGLMEMSRQRLRPGMLESTTQPCAHCHGTGIIRSDDSLGLQVLRALEEEGTRKRSREVLLRAPIGIVNFLINNKREHIAQIESRTGMAVRIECDPAMISPDFTIEKFKTATRAVPAASSVISGNASLMGAPVAEEYLDDAVLDDVADPISDDIEDAAPEPKSDAHGDGEGGKKRRRRRRRKPRAGGQNGAGDDAAQLDDDAEDGSDDGNDATADVAADAAGQSLPPAAAALADKPKRTRAPRGGKTSVANTAPATAQDAVAEAFAPPTKDADGKDEQAAAKPANGRRKSAAKADAAAGDDAPAPAKAAAKPARAPRKPKAAPAETTAEGPADAPAAATEPAVQVTSDAPALDTGAPNPPVPDKPRKRGWWSSKA